MGSSASAAEKQRIENLFTKRLCDVLGGPARAEQGYRDWLRLSAAAGPLEVDELTQKLQWESAFDGASCTALFDSGAGTGEFFVIHLGQKAAG